MVLNSHHAHSAFDVYLELENYGHGHKARVSGVLGIEKVRSLGDNECPVFNILLRPEASIVELHIVLTKLAATIECLLNYKNPITWQQ